MSSKMLMNAFEKRTEGDYEDFIIFTTEEVESLLDDMKEFITRMKKEI
jgi:uncharacterized protein (UPF0332 family)